MRVVLVAGLLALAPTGSDAHAQGQPPHADAKRYFEAGADAYGAGDYLAAVQALEAAYRLAPLPEIAFSLAQAERRQYFASQQVEHLERALTLYRRYLGQVPSGGRRADVTDALGQLEPIALARSIERAERSDRALRGASEHQTRIMVRSRTPGAAVSLDGGPTTPAPLIAKTTAGPHRVVVEAPGYFSVEQSVMAIEGELVPIEATLQARPAVVAVRDLRGAELFVDGMRANPAPDTGRLELPAGEHRLAFAKRGHRVQLEAVTLGRGDMRVISPDLSWTGQRVAAVSLLAVGAVVTTTGLVLAGLALSQESTAKEIHLRRRDQSISPAEREEYASAVVARNRLRTLSAGGLVLGAGTLLTGLLLYHFDHEQPDSVAAVRTVSILPLEAGAIVSVRGSTSL
ncbi:MAG: PEGA domain-containing protein [Myxococcales bacterium]|nr:PEGA domain-containing protein [Myxococcales bacterium]